MQDILTALYFVYDLPFFWNSMAWSTIIAMFFGALIYDGDIPHAKRGVAAVGSYIFMMMLVFWQYTITRYPVIQLINPTYAFQIFIYPTILIYLSFFWFLGFVFAIWLFRYLRRKRG